MRCQARWSECPLTILFGVFFMQAIFCYWAFCFLSSSRVALIVRVCPIMFLGCHLSHELLSNENVSGSFSDQFWVRGFLAFGMQHCNFSYGYCFLQAITTLLHNRNGSLFADIIPLYVPPYACAYYIQRCICPHTAYTIISGVFIVCHCFGYRCFLIRIDCWT